MADLIRRVGGHLVLDVQAPARLVLKLAVSDMPGTSVDESLTVTLDDTVLPATETSLWGEGRTHLVTVSRPGRLVVDYRAVVAGRADPAPVTEAERVVYLRPSRYAESDRLAGLARWEFAGLGDPEKLLAAVSSWVGTQLRYVPGSSRPTDGAVDTLLIQRGVCRDYAHLVVAVLRALDVPARVAAVYAPGLSPMDFHVVAEAAVDGCWRVADATALAPRSSLVRIATGRDATDIAFLSSYDGAVELTSLSVTAMVDGDLPADDVTQLVSIT